MIVALSDGTTVITSDAFVQSVFGQQGIVSGGTVTGQLAMAGPVLLTNLPTSDPLVTGQIWNNLGVLNISSG